MGIFDEIGNDDDPEALLGFSASAPSPQLGWRALEGLALLRAERIGGSAALVRLGAFAADIAHLPAPARESWALLNLDRIMRRILASAGLEPADLLPALIAGAPLAAGLGADAASARFLLCSSLPLLAADNTVHAIMVSRLLERLRPSRLEDRDRDVWLDEQIAIDEVVAIARQIQQLLDERMQSTDPLFAITDVLATYGGALHGFPMDHLPDNSAATMSEMLLESFRHAGTLTPALSRARRAIPDGALLCMFDVAVAASLVRHLKPMPPLTGLIRRDLFRRDLHYPADFGSLIAALKASMAAGARDLALVTAWSAQASRLSARVQQIALSALTCFGTIRPSALAQIAGSSWQGVETALRPLEQSGVVTRQSGLWRLQKSAERLL